MSVPAQNLKRKLKSALPWAVAESIASAFFTLLTTVTAARLITAHDFGRASIILAIVTVIQSLFLIGPSNAVSFSRWVYRQRNLVERSFNRIKQMRGIATRYDRRADNYLAALKLTATRIWIASTNESVA